MWGLPRLDEIEGRGDCLARLESNRRSGRVVDRGSLESCCGRKPTVGSNPTSSAIRTNSNPCVLRLRAQGFEFWYGRRSTA